MIPIDKLIPIEAKAREYGYETVIHDGGRHVKFSKYIHGGSFALTCNEYGILMWNPENDKVTIEKFNEFLEEQQQLLELAMMLQENIIEEPPEVEC